MKTIDEQNDEIRARVNEELPRPAGGFETGEAEEAWRDAHEKRFLELCAESVNETKHTPGPWEACGCTIYAWENRIGQTWDAEDDGLPTPEMEANARLIASAPDLLWALRRALPHIEDQDAYNYAREMIAKARGGAA